MGNRCPGCQDKALLLNLKAASPVSQHDKGDNAANIYGCFRRSLRSRAGMCQGRVDPGRSAEQQSQGVGWAQEAITMPRSKVSECRPREV